MKVFFLKVKHFFKRNIYPITVSFCTILVLAIVTISAYSAIKNSDDNVISQPTAKPKEEQVINTDTGGGDIKDEVVEPISSNEPIIFDLPFKSATISKQYADSYLLYDTTTKLWCTHQGLDFSCIDGQDVVAVYDGEVEKIENTMMNGSVVYLRVSEDLVVVYKGLSSNLSVKEGDKITKGAVIGKVTSFLAEKADGVHLHLELLKNNNLIDPTEYFAFNK